MISRAVLEDHKAILQVAKQSPYTRDFSNRIFSGPEMYAKGWIRIHQEGILPSSPIEGFTCVRHKVRAPETVLYFIGVDKKAQRRGIGEFLLYDLIEQSPHRRLVLNVMKANEQARAFYRKHGFKEEGDSLEGAGVRLAREW